MSFFSELNKNSFQETHPNGLLSTLKEAYSWNTVHHARSAGKKALEEPTPFLDLIVKVIDELKSQGYTIKKDGASHRRLGWEISHPDWVKDCVLYLNWYAARDFNTNSDQATGDWAQAWTRYLDSKGFPKLGPKIKFSLDSFDNDLRNMMRDFVVFQDNHLR